MAKLTLASSASSPSTTASELPESVRRSLAPVPETRGSRVVVLEPVVVATPLPEGFIDIDDYIEEQEKDPVTGEAIAAGRKALADNYYGDEPKVLAWYRLKQGWSQKELAARMGTSLSYIARLEASEAVVSFEPCMWATYCDDVRQEAGNKLSYMGVYQASLIVPSLPATLPKLCCVLNVRVPAKSPPRKILFKLLRGKETIFEADASQVEQAEARDTAPPLPMGEYALTLTAIAQFQNFPISERVMLKTVAIVDGKELRGGGLELMAAPAPPRY